MLTNTHDFSAMLNPDPVAPMRFEPEGDDITAQIEAAMGTGPMDLMVSYDGKMHADARSLLNPLFVPSRLKANEEFMRGLADEMVREMVAKGGCEMITDMATPFVTLVIADLLGVPADDRQKFREIIDSGPPPGNMDAGDQPQSMHPLMIMAGYFMRYMAERRASPQDDILTELALSKYPDGTTPGEMEPVKTAMFLFAAGQDTSAKLIGNSLRRLCEDPALQAQLRADPSQIGPFLEEVLRLEGSVKANFRLAKRNCRIGEYRHSRGQEDRHLGRRGEPRSAPLGRSRRVPPRPAQDQGTPRLRPRPPRLRRRAARTQGSHGALREAVRAHLGHPPVRSASRTRGRAADGIRGELHHPRPRRPACGAGGQVNPPRNGEVADAAGG